MTKAAVILATGPSLNAHDIELFISDDISLYAVNDAYRLAPYADYLLAGDCAWWNYHMASIKQFVFAELWTTDRSAKNAHSDLNHFQFPRPFPGTNSAILSAYMAIHHHGHRRLVLLGQDLHDRDGKHFFGPHPDALSNNSRFGRFIRHYNEAKRDYWDQLGVEIVNATPGSDLKCYPIMTPLEALKWLQENPAPENPSPTE